MGEVFLTLIRMLVLPLIFVSLVCGVASLGDVRQLGRIGLKTLALYVVTTALAIPVGLFIAVVLEPGTGPAVGAAW